MGPVLRKPTSDDLPAIRSVDEFAFGTEFPDSVWNAWSDSFPLERSWVAEVDQEIIGLTASHPFQISVPGRWVPAAGVTFVAVHPAHRRQGVLRSLMTRQLNELAAAGEPIALLWASEPAIYGRYGFGSAAEHIDLTVPADPAALPVIPGEESLRVDTPTPLEARSAAVAVLQRVGALRPGVLSTEEQIWPLRVLDAPERRHGAGRLRAAVVSDNRGDPVAYALFAPKQKWDRGQADGEVAVREFAAVDAAARSRLWRFLMSLDLMASLNWEDAPSDEPLQLMTHASRQLITGRRDSLWLRVLDVEAALLARDYAGQLDLVFEIHDGLIADCAGRWRLTNNAGTASCARTEAPADLSLSVAALGAAYLGGQSFTRLADAGLVAEHTPGTLAAATVAFGSTRQPWCPFMF
jgi:predicted acetyltransferase